MKNIILAFFAGLIPALAFTNDASAQASNLMAYKDAVNNYFKLGNTDASINPNTINLDMVNKNALKIFSQKYKVTGEKWGMGKNCITATYELDGISQTIYFDINGYWVGSLKTYNEDIMPKDIRKMIKEEYYGYKISLVREVETLETGGNPVYIISVENSKRIVEVRIQGYEMDVYNDFKKS